jgi:hypothetical protein
MKRSQMTRFRHGAGRIPVLFPSGPQGGSEDEVGRLGDSPSRPD